MDVLKQGTAIVAGLWYSMKSDVVHIGVDVSKEKLAVFVPPPREGMRPVTREMDNSIAGFRELRGLARKAKATVCVEPTGGYELEVIAFMHKFDIPVAYTDALRVRQFARAEGCLSKNDTIDAALISRFADKIGVRVLEAQEVEAVELKRKAKFREAGAHVWLETDDVLAAGRGYVMVHAASDGEKAIRLPGTFDAREIFGASPARKGASEIVETMKRGETRVWRLGK